MIFGSVEQLERFGKVSVLSFRRLRETKEEDFGWKPLFDTIKKLRLETDSQVFKATRDQVICKKLSQEDPQRNVFFKLLYKEMTFRQDSLTYEMNYECSIIQNIFWN